MSRTEMSEATDSALSAAAREAMRGGAPGDPGALIGGRAAAPAARRLGGAARRPSRDRRGDPPARRLALLAAATLLEPGLANTSWLPPWSPPSRSSSPWG
ncbi:hypothetical protein [Serinibacter salmoneus]|uniref:hypothetical protein n=1 Tax=Serinibacter salmoneus TaxID=556530 RepID=UPI00117A7717|nr:hypothetical protein [Serinibacter salmoneus]